MAETQTTPKKTITLPPSEFKVVLDPGNADDAFAAVGDAGREAKILMVPFEAIHPIAGFNVRIHDAAYEAHVEAIKESIKQNGFFRHRPLKAFTSKEGDLNLFMLADGYTRFEGAKRAVAEGAKIGRLPIVTTPKGTSMDDLMIGLDADNDSRPLSAFERAILIKRLQNMGNDEDEIADKMRITKQYVGDLLKVMEAPKALHNMITSGEVATQLAIELIKEHGSGKKVVEILKDAGATGEKKTGDAETTRVTRKNVAASGGTAKAGKRLYEALIEYLIVLGKNSGGQAAYDFLVRWNDKEADAVKELNKVAKKTAKPEKKAKNPKDVRIKITDDMSDDDKKAARAHNKEVKARKERREKRAAKAANQQPEPV